MTRKQIISGICLMLAVILIASGSYLFLYHFNNKYTRPSLQPANGLFILSEEDLAAQPLTFLTSGWAYYPDVLLTPADFDNQTSNHYMIYTEIGQYSHFDLTGNDQLPHGSATYALWLSLPPGTVCALELPEIFSSCNVYIDDHLIFRTGNPDPSAYKARTQEHFLTFTSTGNTRILLSVSDYSHYYSGLTYPPAFGTPEAVSRYQNLRLGICMAADALALLIALLAFYLGFRMHYKNALCFGGLCLAMVGFTSYPLIHTFFELPVFPLYAMELFCGYLIPFFVLLLHNQICETDRRPSTISQYLALFFCLLSFGYSACAPMLTTGLMQVFSGLVFTYKVFLVLWLLITASLAFKRQTPESVPLFYGDLFYATSFFWDLLLPKFEPVYGGWFSEWGTSLLLLMILYTLWNDLVKAYSFRLTFSEEQRQLTRQIAIQKTHYQDLSDRIEETVRIRHDFRHHMQLLNTLVEEGEYEKLKDHLKDYRIASNTDSRTVLCRNLIIDAILQYYNTRCQQNHIDLSVHAELPAELPYSDTDLSILFGNLLENAFEACTSQINGRKYIRLQAGWQREKLCLRVENSHSNQIHTHKGRYLSTKHDGDGIGTQSVRALTERLNGQIKFDVTDNTFRVSVIL